MDNTLSNQINKQIKFSENKQICVYPFKAAEVYPNGDVSCCWCPYLDYRYKFGNLFKQNFDEFWNGKKAQKIRRDVLKRKYSYCKLDRCIQNIDDQLFFQETDEGLNEISDYPVYVSFAHECSCTCKCVTCRDEIYLNDEKTTKKFDSLIETSFIPMLKNAKLVEMSGSGEIFVSKHYRKLIKRITETYPDIRFYIMTNGIGCTIENLKELGLYDRLESLQISLHAAKKQTYDAIVRGGDFIKVAQNLKAVSKMKEEGLIPEVLMNFVVSSMNFQDMPDFVKWARYLDFRATFWEFRDWETSEMCHKFHDYAVYEPEHPLHEKLKEVLKDPILFSKWSNLNQIFFNLAPVYSEEELEKIKEQDKIYDEQHGRKPNNKPKRIKF